MGGTGPTGSGFDVITAGKCFDKYLYFVGYTYSSYGFSDYISRAGAYNGTSMGGGLILRFNMESTPLKVKSEDLTYNELLFYPNYVVDKLNIKNTNSSKIERFSVYNNQGILLDSGMNNLGKEVLEIGFKDYSSGMYHVKIEIGNSIIWQKIIKL